jgi:hypothetical protein
MCARVQSGATVDDLKYVMVTEKKRVISFVSKCLRWTGEIV